MLRAVWHGATTSVVGFLWAILVFVGWTLGLSFMAVAVIKVVLSDNVGVFMRNGSWSGAGAMLSLPPGVQAQPFGCWVVPVSIMIGLGILVGTQRASRRILSWRRSRKPPALGPDDPRRPGHDPRYVSLRPEELSFTESLKDTVARVLPIWDETIAPGVRQGQRVLIAAHGNSLRALVKYLDSISDDKIAGLNIPTGIPLVHELTDDLTPVRNYCLADPEASRSR
jgi:hypothetical protein